MDNEDKLSESTQQLKENQFLRTIERLESKNRHLKDQMIEYEVENDSLRTQLKDRGKELMLAKELLQQSQSDLE